MFMSSVLSHFLMIRMKGDELLIEGQDLQALSYR